MATVAVPARTTSALTVPAGTVRLASSGFVQTGDDDGAAGPHVDGGGRGGVPDGDARLAGRDGGDVVDERRQRGLPVRGQVGHHGGVGAGGHGDAVRPTAAGCPTRQRRRPGRGRGRRSRRAAGAGRSGCPAGSRRSAARRWRRRRPGCPGRRAGPRRSRCPRPWPGWRGGPARRRRRRRRRRGETCGSGSREVPSWRAELPVTPPSGLSAIWMHRLSTIWPGTLTG